MNPRHAAGAVLAAVALLATPLARPVAAQSPGAARRAAENAADRTNENLAKQTGQAVPAPRGQQSPGQQPQGQQPGAAQPRAGAQPGTGAVTERAPGSELTLERETYAYRASGRDPFLSLIKTGDLRPQFSDLKLTAVIYDETGRNSVAVLRDVSSKDQYRVKQGQMVGRMRVSAIRRREVVFTIEEFGASRQQTLAMTDTTQVRRQ